MSTAIRQWGSTAMEQRDLDYACDRLVQGTHDACHRAIDVDAPSTTTFRWLCQLRVAPYSYDWIDNLGRRSPRHLVAGLDNLCVGQRAMTVFEVAAFEPGRQLTFVLTRPRRARGAVAATYMVLPRGPHRSRIVVKLVIRYPGPLAVLRRCLPPLGTLLLAGDLVMMRRQLLNLRRLAEAS